MVYRLLWIGWIGLFLANSPVYADSVEIGQIKSLAGEVFITRDGTKFQAQARDLLQQADILETGMNGSVGITFIDNSRFSAGPNTRIELKQFRFNPTTQEGDFITDMNRGTLTIVSGQIAKHSPEAMKLKTPTTILGFRGTKVAVKVIE
ncbi:MAG: FecR domain-containing protein [Deltaproteobacteria bacterium]|nr:FecR domain-containing protein [Deltaproteobacteria bacterium]